MGDLDWQRTTFPSRRHERVHEMLTRVAGDGAARFFAGACEIAQRDPPYRTTTHIVAHLIREVESATREVLIKLPKAAEFIAANPPTKETERATHKLQIKAILAAVELQDVHEAANWNNFTGDGGLHSRAHRPGLRSPRAPDTEFEASFDDFVVMLHVVLTRFEERYGDVIAALRAVSTRDTPTDDDVKYVVAHLGPSATANDHVFATITHHWLIQLRSKGAFREPPEIRHHEGGSYSMPRWPQARYLARIAADMPHEVVNTIERIPIVDNESVHLDFFDAATRMPGTFASRVARHELKWLTITKHIGTLGARAIQELAAHLIGEDEIATARLLLENALHLEPPPQSGPWRDPGARLAEWDYGELIKGTLPLLATSDADTARSLLHDLIDTSGADQDSPWRHRIDGHGHPGVADPIDVLFVRLRDLYSKHAATSPVALRDCVTTLEARNTKLYRQLALYLLRQHGAGTPDLVVARATDEDLLRANDELDSELVQMIGSRFGDLDPTAQRQVIDAFRAVAAPQAVRVEFGDGVEENLLAQVSAHRMRIWLHVLGDARPASVRDEYQALIATSGVPESRSYQVRHGPTSPRRAADLSALSDADLIAYLRERVPSSTDPFEDSRQGLGHELKSCVTQDVARFAKLAREFCGLAAPYVGSLIWGIHDSIKEAADDEGGTVARPAIDWAAVIDLAEWAVQQSTTAGSNDEWASVRRMTTSLCEDAFHLLVGVDDGQAVRAWNLVRRLMNDVDPSPERDQTHKGDAEGFAINTVRGQALRAAIRFALYLRKKQGDAPAGLLAEVAAAIAERADPLNEPSDAVRAMIATEFNVMHYVDADTARSIASKLFDTTSAVALPNSKAWHQFVRWNDPMRPIFDLLRPSYEAAIEAVASTEAVVATALGVHLLRLAIYGTHTAEADAKRLREFIQRAQPEVRYDVLADVGRALYRTKDTVAPALMERMQSLWGEWASVVRKAQNASELRAFGWWFAKDHFDPAWSLATLEGVLDDTGGNIDQADDVLERLTKLASAFPNPVAACVRKYVNTTNDWQIMGNNKPLRAVLEALNATDAAHLAKAAASVLIARGWPSFTDLA